MKILGMVRKSLVKILGMVQIYACKILGMVHCAHKTIPVGGIKKS